MSDLKKYRLSLKFSEKDPDQVEVVNLLKQMGRRKSQFITKAVLYYLNNEPEAEIPMPNVQNMNKNTLKGMLLELLQEMNFTSSTKETKLETFTPKVTEINTEDKQTQDTQEKSNVVEIEIDENDLDDFLDGLDNF